MVVAGRRQLFDIRRAQVQPGDADVPPVARPAPGLRTQLHLKGGRRQIRAGHVHRARRARRG